MMEVILHNVKAFMILFALILLFLDYIIPLEGYLIPISLGILVFPLFFFKETYINPVGFLFFIGIPFLMYAYRYMNKNLTKSDGGWIGRIPLLKDLIMRKRKWYFDQLNGQFGYVVKKFGNNLYLVSFNIGIRGKGKRKFKCFSYKELKVGDHVVLTHMDENGNFYVDLSNV